MCVRSAPSPSEHGLIDKFRKEITALINKLMAKVFGTSNEREIKRLMPLVERINVLEPEMKQLSDEQLRAKTDEFRKRIGERVDPIEDVEEKAAALKEVLDDILPEAFAVARAENAPFRCAAHRRHSPASRPDRRDENWRR